jgi:hypothetical protein
VRPGWAIGDVFHVEHLILRTFLLAKLTLLWYEVRRNNGYMCTNQDNIDKDV